MKLTVLIDNNTYIDRYYLGEPAVSYYIEDGGRKILFDAGYSGAFIKNAEAMGIHLEELTDVVISHGHNDHTGGLTELMKTEFTGRPIFTAHPDVFLKRSFEGLDIGCPISEAEVSDKFDMRLTDRPVKITDNIIFLGEIPSVHEKRYEIGTAVKDGKETGDSIMDDSALACMTEDGIYIVTGCSHSGICNIIERAKQVCRCERVIGIIGGMHLFETDERSRQTIDFIKKENPKELYPCHCTSFKVKAEMDRSISVTEVGVGLKLEWREAE
ncbi:MAG: MBL fold metallo-hydrolase [Clostridia bacterium]|nr:MBL fold metallo-hydrolase [Clostridia bacterium]